MRKRRSGEKIRITLQGRGMPSDDSAASRRRETSARASVIAFDEALPTGRGQAEKQPAAAGEEKSSG